MHRSWGLPAVGAIALAALAWHTAVTESPAIERDLLLRTTAALRNGGLEIPQDGVRIYGQTAILSGPPGSPLLSEDAQRRAGAVWGVTDVLVEPWGVESAAAASRPVPLPTPSAAPQSLRVPTIAPPADPKLAQLERDLQGRQIGFRGSTNTLLPESRRALDELASLIRAAPSNSVVEIAAHTDSDGNEAKNLALSKRRAAAVRRYLASRGVRQNRMRDQGYGQTRPVAPNDSESNKAQNRRVEFHVVSTRSF